MTGPELGYAALCSDLSDGLIPLTAHQVKILGRRVRLSRRPADPARDLTAADLAALGYDEEMTGRILALLSRQERIEAYLAAGERLGIRCLTILSPQYPERLRRSLGDKAPGVLYCKGDLSLLCQPAVCVVGSRRVSREGRQFADQVGGLAAREGWVLVSGNAQGADKAAQTTALLAGGSVISVLADALDTHALRGRRLLLLSERGWDLPFSAARALSRNRVIHALGEKTFVADAELEQGGTWRGTVENLRSGYSQVYVRRADTPGLAALAGMGAVPVSAAELSPLSDLRPAQMDLWNRSEDPSV